MRRNKQALLEESRAEREAEHGQKAGPGQKRSQSRAEREERVCERRQRVGAKEKARKRARPQPQGCEKTEKLGKEAGQTYSSVGGRRAGESRDVSQYGF